VFKIKVLGFWKSPKKLFSDSPMLPKREGYPFGAEGAKSKRTGYYSNNEDNHCAEQSRGTDCGEALVPAAQHLARLIHNFPSHLLTQPFSTAAHQYPVANMTMGESVKILGCFLHTFARHMKIISQKCLRVRILLITTGVGIE